MPRFREVPDPRERAVYTSEYNSGWRFWVSVGAGTLLLLYGIYWLITISWYID